MSQRIRFGLFLLLTSLTLLLSGCPEVTLTPSETTAPVGQPVTITAKLVDGGAPVANEEVVLRCEQGGSRGGFKTSGGLASNIKVTTDEAGAAHAVFVAAKSLSTPTTFTITADRGTSAPATIHFVLP